MKRFENKPAESAINKNTTLFWFRRDLRIQDNAGLYHALKENANVLPIFIFDTEIRDKLEDEKDARVEFIHQTIQQIKSELEALGCSLAVLHGNPIEIFKTLNPKAVYTNHDYESYGNKRDEHVKRILEEKGSAFYSFKDIVIFEKDEIVKDDGSPYTVYTPYSKKWKAALTKFYTKSYPVEKYFDSLLKLKPLPFPKLEEIGFSKSGIAFPERKIKQAIIEKYHLQRDIPGIEGTSRLSVHLRFGTVSIRRLVQVALKKNEKWLNELIWRDFYHMILWHFPHVVSKAFKPAYDQIEWRNDPVEFKAWCEGKTGYPIVDAGMRELNETGYMHNRVRMIVASFLTKHLLIDWRWGEAYFAKKLLDFDLAANNGGWQWAAGSGCDAAPYFRVFNPYIQTEKFDPERTYIKRWVPEMGTPDYPQPIVDHAFARERVLAAYKVALES
ncbi:MAG: deoxyribodipyrimidine photo-lyase [Cyclobacteriaceae bacterium]|nr:MAG: deoxyribodipyrimidine photo-lyase [Cyclobacteriaceae bacterium]